MTSKLTRAQLHERARENVKALKLASRQTAFESAREEILADLQLAELALAAMDSESECLPLDYLQGHKDGLEWAAKLAEANHPETGDWLYDDSIELAKAIRKGPDMPPVQPVADSEPVAWVSSESLDSRLAGIEAVTIPFVPGIDIPLFRHPVVTHNGGCDTDPFGFARRSGDLVVIDVNGDPHIKDGMPLYRHAQQPVVSEVGAQVSEQPAPAVPGKWIPVSERMPETDGNYWGWWSESKRQGPVWFIKSELQAQFQSHEITHWMPLPSAPHERKT